MNTSINFPNLGIHLSNVGKSISIGGFEIAYYGMIIACGMILGLCFCHVGGEENKPESGSVF